MLPIRDLNPARRRAIVTTIVILINVLVFLYQVMLPPPELNRYYMTYAIVPYRLTQAFSLGAALTLLTSMFMHGGVAHILSNMLYLYIFGDNVEDALGHVPFLAFYLICGLGAALAQVAMAPNSRIPMLGASGAIAGVLGAYIVFYPKARVQSLVFFGLFARLIELPAIIVLGLWFILQFFSGVLALGTVQTGGVAWFAHIGGFVLGMVGALFCKLLGCQPPPPKQITYRYPDTWGRPW